MIDEPLEQTPDRADQVARVIALMESGKSERKACSEVGINRATFRAAALRTGAGDHYARALVNLAEDQVEKMERVLTSMRNGTIKPDAARVELDARKWFASKFLPKRYGDRQVLAGDPDAPLSGMSVDQVNQRIAELLGKSS